jgi:ABC-2 type transport system permease protein
VCDLDRSAKSRAFIRTLDATETIRVIAIQGDPAQGKASVESGEAEGEIVIPDGFERDLLHDSRPAIRAYINSTRFMQVSDIGKGITDAIAFTGHDLLVQTFESRGLSRENAFRYAEPIILQARSLGNTSNSYGDFIIPAILLLILQQTLFSASAVAAAGTRRKARSAPTGMPISIWLFGKGIPYFVIYCLYAVFFFTLHYRIWRIPFTGNVDVLAVISAVHFAAIIASGFFLGSFCRSHLTALILGIMSTYPIFLLSGIPWPVSSMPEVFQIVSLLLPSTYFIPATFAASRLGGGWADTGHFVASLTTALAIIVPILCVKMKLQISAGRKKSQ